MGTVVKPQSADGNRIHGCTKNKSSSFAQHHADGGDSILLISIVLVNLCDGTIAADIEKNGGPGNLQEKDIVALIAYVQRLGQDIKLASQAPATTAARAPVATAPVTAQIARKTP